MRAMTARILGIQRASQELWVPWHRRIRREAGKVLTSLGIHPWGTSLCLKTLTWAGHVARLPDSRLCKQVPRWRGLEWWRRRQALIELHTGIPAFSRVPTASASARAFRPALQVGDGCGKVR